MWEQIAGREKWRESLCVWWWKTLISWNNHIHIFICTHTHIPLAAEWLYTSRVALLLHISGTRGIVSVWLYMHRIPQILHKSGTFGTLCGRLCLMNRNPTAIQSQLVALQQESARGRDGCNTRSKVGNGVFDLKKKWRFIRANLIARPSSLWRKSIETNLGLIQTTLFTTHFKALSWGCSSKAICSLIPSKWTHFLLSIQSCCVVVWTNLD